MKENPSFLKEQIITYLGNKGALLGFLDKGFKVAKEELGKDKLSFCDIFSGSGVVSRFAKVRSNYILTSDLENYSKLINKYYLSNKDKNLTELLKRYHKILTQNLEFQAGFISKLYAPKDEACIQKDERVFCTLKNALYPGTLRQKIEKEIPEELKHFFIAPLVYGASVHSNISRVFKGFYKGRDGVGEFGGEAQDALKYTEGDIELKMPTFSNFPCEFEVVQKDANLPAKELENIDAAYLDPPYNQHPYSSNYFILNLIANYQRSSEISKIPGIPRDWNRSIFNKERQAEDALFKLINDLKAKIILLSYNCEDFVKKEKFLKRLQSLGECQTLEQKHPIFRASRDLKNRSIHIHEQLYILKKKYLIY